MKIDRHLPSFNQVFNKIPFDYIPFASTAGSMVKIYDKAVLLPKKDTEEVDKDRFWRDLKGTSYTRLFILLVPVAGNLAVGAYDAANYLRTRNYKKL